MADYIVAIDLGTSHITGIVGEKNADGTFTILAYDTEETISKTQKSDTEDAISCIYRGIIYNRDNTATHIANLIKKLESRMNGDTIDKVYVGVGGQSLRTIEHIVTMEVEEGAAVTEDDLADLNYQCGMYKQGTQDVLGMAPAVYFLDGRKDTQPVGVSCKHLEAHYKLVVGRSSIRSDITKSVALIPEKTLAGIFVSPLALADAALSKKEKELGCALVDFGAGVTSVSVYKDGVLQHLCVIPLGGNLITRDLKVLQLTKDEAEKLKVEKGSAILSNEEENILIKIETDGADRVIKLSDLNAIIEARAKEIVENVNAQITGVIELRQLGSGITLAGSAAELSKLPDLLKEKCRVNIRYATVQNGLVQGADEMLGNPMYMMAISLMLKGTETCVTSKQATNQESTNLTSPVGINTGSITKNEPQTKNPDDTNRKIHSDFKIKNPKGRKKALSEWMRDIFTTES